MEHRFYAKVMGAFVLISRESLSIYSWSVHMTTSSDAGVSLSAIYRRTFGLCELLISESSTETRAKPHLNSKPGISLFIKLDATSNCS